MNNYNFEATYKRDNGDLYQSFHFNMQWEDICYIVGMNADEIVDIDIVQVKGDLLTLHPHSGMRKIGEIYEGQREEIKKLKLEIEALQGVRKSLDMYEKSIEGYRKENVKLTRQKQGLSNELETINKMLHTLGLGEVDKEVRSKPLIPMPAFENGVRGMKLVRADVDSFHMMERDAEDDGK